MKNFSHDIEFLEKNNIIDYSLLICFREYKENEVNDKAKQSKQLEQKIQIIENNNQSASSIIHS